MPWGVRMGSLQKRTDNTCANQKNESCPSTRGMISSTRKRMVASQTTRSLAKRESHASEPTTRETGIAKRLRERSQPGTSCARPVRFSEMVCAEEIPNHQRMSARGRKLTATTSRVANSRRRCVRHEDSEITPVR